MPNVTNFRPGQTLTAAMLNEAFALVHAKADAVLATANSANSRSSDAVSRASTAATLATDALSAVSAAANSLNALSTQVAILVDFMTNTVPTDYATKELVTNALSNIDLSNYATKSYVNSAVSAVDLTDYATKSFVASAIAALNIADYATKEYVTNAIAALDIGSYVTGTMLNTAISDFATTQYVDTAIANAELNGGGSVIDLTPYALKTYVDARVDAIDLSEYLVSEDLDDINSTLIQHTTSLATALSGITAVNEALSDYATLTSVTSAIDAAIGNIDLSDYATTDYVTSAIAALGLSNYATQSYVTDAIAAIDLTNYTTKTYVDNAVANVSVDLTGYATEDYVTAAVSNVLDTLPVATDDVFTLRTKMFDDWRFKGLGAADWDSTPIFQIIDGSSNSNDVPLIYIIDYEHETSENAQAFMQNCEAIPGAPMKFYCRCGETAESYAPHLYAPITVQYTYGELTEQSITIDPAQYFPEPLLNSSEWVDPADAILPVDTYSDDDLEDHTPDKYADYPAASAFYTERAEERTFDKYADAIELMGNSLTLYKRHYRDRRTFWRWPESRVVFDYYIDNICDISAECATKNVSCGHVRNIYAVYAPSDVQYTVVAILDSSNYSNESEAITAAEALVTAERSCVVVSTPTGWHIVGRRAVADDSVTFMLLFDIPAAMTVVLPSGQGLYSNGSWVAISTDELSSYNLASARLDVLYRRKAVTGESSLYDYYKHPFRAGLPVQSTT